MLFGLAPALQGARLRPQALDESARTTGGPASGRLRSILVAAQVGLAVVLLAGAMLTTRSLLRMLDQDAGFEPARLATLCVFLPQERYPDAPCMVAVLREVRDRLAALPGVEGVDPVAAFRQQ